jgi:outer membrane protein assembly factor BamB
MMHSRTPALFKATGPARAGSVSPGARWTTLLLAATVWLGGQSAPPATEPAEDESAAARRPAKGDGEPAAPLVDVDGSVEDRLHEIARWVQEKRYDEAQEALHALMASPSKAALHAVPGDVRRYETTLEAAARLLGTFPDEALDLYCKRHDLAAAKRFDEARQRPDEGALLSVGRRYFHTPSGGRAMALAAAIAFDRADHLRAAAIWERLYREHRRLGAGRAMLLAKAAVAWRLGGSDARAAALLRELKDRHAGAEAAVAGQRTSLAGFVEKALSQEPNTAMTPPRPVADWASLAGSPHSVAVSPDCDAAPLPIWTDAEPARAGFLRDLLGIAAGEAPAGDHDVSVVLDAGRVRVRRAVTGQSDVRFDLPPLVHPVVVGGVLLCRREAGVVATSLESGKELWRTRRLPVHGGGRDGPVHPQFALAGDMGRYALTAGDGRLYTVCGFSSSGQRAHRSADGDPFGGSDGSTLTALAVRPDGADAVWEVGNGKGDGESLRQTKYLAAPTLHEGRLHVLGRRGNRYLAMCLDAARGTLLWETPLGVVPMRGGATMTWQQVWALEVTTERGSPPAVADGTVFHTTNAGIVAALDAATGSPLWAHRYDSHVSGPADRPSGADLQGQAIRVATLRRPYPPVNPLVVTQGRVLCLPCDGNAVLALHARTGELLWRRDRGGQQDLTAVDDSAVLLSGPDLAVLSVRDGAVRHRWTSDVLGRPAVAPGSIVAAGVGGLLRVDLAGGTVARRPLAGDADAVLGRLVSSGGRLVAVNASGASVYADYDTAWRMVQSALLAAPHPARRAELALRAGMLALASDHLDDAVRQLTLAADGAGKAGAGQVAGRAADLLFEAYMRQFRSAGDKPEARAHIDQASRYASTPARRERVLLERVRLDERLGRADQAVRCAQAAAADQADRWRAGGGSSLTEYFAARRELARLIGKHGDGAYAAFDANLSAAMDQAAGRGDPNADELIAIHRRWPLARRSGEALLLAADGLFRRATASSQPDPKLAMRAARTVAEAGGLPREETRVAALAAQLVMDLRLRPNLAAARAAELGAVKPATPVRFGPYAGTVGDLLARAAQAGRRPLPPHDPEFADIGPPLRLADESATGPAVALHDAGGQVLRLGDRVFISSREAVTCLDAQRGGLDAAALWTVGLAPLGDPAERLGQLSSDGRLLAVLDRGSLVAVDVLSGKERHRVRLDWLGPRGWVRAAGDGDWLVLADETGLLTCLDIRDGKRPWRLRLPRLGIRTLTACSAVLLAGDSDDGRHVFCDIRTGRVLAEARPRDARGRVAAALLTPDALAVTLDDDGTVQVRDVRPGPDGLALTGKWDAADWRPLACGGRFAAFRSGAGDGRVRVLDMADPGRPIDLRAGDDPNRLPLPVRAVFSGDRAVLLHAAEVRGGELTAPGLAAFELPSGKRLWNRALAATPADACRITPPCLHGGFLGLTVLSADGTRTVRACVIRVEDGEVIDCPMAAAQTGRAWPPAGSPIPLNGWVLVPHQAGLTCFVSAQP